MNRNSKEKEIIGSRADDAYQTFAKKIYRQIGEIFAKKLVDTKVTANQVTVVSFLIWVLSAYFFFRADHISLIIGAILLHAGYAIDHIDGSLARMRNSTSVYGAWLDLLSGTYGYALVFIGATLGVYSQVHEPYILVFGFLGIIGALIKNVTQYFYLNKFQFASKFGIRTYKKKGFIMFLRYSAPFVNMVFTIGAIFNRLDWVLIFCGIYAPLYSIVQNSIFTLKARKMFLKEKKST